MSEYYLGETFAERQKTRTTEDAAAEKESEKAEKEADKEAEKAEKEVDKAEKAVESSDAENKAVGRKQAVRK